MVLAGSSGFVYYVSITGVTGTRTASAEELAAAIPRIRRFTDLPIAIGFGVRTPAQAPAAVQAADAAVVASALIDTLADSLDERGRAGPDTVRRRARPGARPGRGRPRRPLTYSSPPLRRFGGGVTRPQGVSHDLAHRIRPPENPHPARPPRGARQSLGAVPGLPADAVPHRTGEKPEGLRPLRPSSAPAAEERLGWTFDNGEYTRIDLPKVPADPLRFRDTKRYTDRLRDAREKTGLDDAIVVAHGTIGGQKAVVAAMAFEFIGGSMGAAVGEGFVAAARLAVLQEAALVVLHRLGRGAHDGGRGQPDADAAHHHRRCAW